ncbi:MAG TPA: hypothetical protein VND15_02455 [Candidatus Acidoferrales bacterium]|nr:hypothetical protein [Candidatus Acidoferrales bacterium]
MNKVVFVALFASLMLIPYITNATYVSVVEPFNATINASNATVYLGKVGPGQTFYVTISAATTYNGVAYPIGWDKLAVSRLPQGWLAQNSSLYTSLISAKITVSPSAANGTYPINMSAVNVGNYSKLGAINFKAVVNVTPDVFKLSVHPTNISTGPGQPADIYVTINNTGVSDSPFQIAVHNLPAWNVTDTVIALHHTSQDFVYPVFINEPGSYHANLYVSSFASPLIYKQTNVTIVTKASVPNDYAALGQGAPIFPITYEPAYSVMYLINLLARHI